MGTIIGLLIPILPDYVQKQDIGRANKYLTVIGTISNTVASAGLFQLVTLIDRQEFIYYGVGLLTFTCGLLSICGLKDVIKEKDPNQKRSAKQLLK